jgi:hypothetical protein
MPLRRLPMTRMITASLVALAVLPTIPALAAEESTEGQVAAAIATLTSKDAMYTGPNGRGAAIVVLVSKPEASAAPLLNELGQNEDPQARLWVLLCMNSFEDMTVFEAGAPKIIALLQDKTFSTKFWAIKTIAKMKLKEAAEPLTQLLAAEDYLLRCAAASALGSLGDETPTPELTKLLEDPRWIVRSAAAEALGELKAAGAKPALIKALDDENLVVLRAAVYALEKITATSFDIDPRDWTQPDEALHKKIKDWIDKNK